MKTGLITRYARKGKDGSVTLYSDKEGNQRCGKYEAWHSSKPTRRNKYITLNCWRWKLEWLP